MVENKEEISLNEFKAWLVGLVRGKNGALPDLNDWKQIKIMLDKVKAERIVIKEYDPFFPYIPNPNPYQPYSPHSPYADKIWCNDFTEISHKWTGQTTNEFMLKNGTSTVHDCNSTLDLTDLDKVFSDWT